jgi:uncharacterized protein YndB with AHSA1/START domain
MTSTLPDITHAIDIDAPRTTVWAVLADAHQVPLWLGCLNYSGVPGSTFHMQPDRVKYAAGDVTGATFCDIEEMRAPEAFVFSWYMPGTPKTTVAVRLEALDAQRTRATLTHSGWGQFPAETVRAFHEMLDGGWKSHVLPNLKGAAEHAGRP